MTLIEVLRELNLEDKNVDIRYKTCAPDWDGKTIRVYTGYCRLEDGYLTPLDRDFYDFDDEIVKYDFNDGKLTVWDRTQTWKDGKWVDIPFPGEE